ncbi:MAG: hypothetical protein AAB426_12915 [Myxococcota bacterium]
MAYRDGAMRAGRIFAWVVFAGLACGTTLAYAKRASRAAEVTLAPLQLRGNASTTLTSALERALVDATSQAGVPVLAGSALTKRLRTSAAQAVARCGLEPACLARLAKRAKTATIVAGRASESGSGIQVAFVVVSAARARIEHKATLDIASAADIPSRLASVFTDLFGVEPPTAAAPALESLADLSLEAVPVVEPAQGADPAQEPSAELDVTPIEPSGGDTAEPDEQLPELAELELVAPPDVMSEPPPDQPTAAASSATQPRRYLRYGGIVSASLGALVLGAASYYGRQHNSLYTEANDRSAGNELSMRDAQDTGDRAYAAGQRANLLFAVGGVAVATGAALIGVDLYRGRSHATTDLGVQVSAGPTGAALRLTW